jgi:hypothetical protein
MTGELNNTGAAGGIPGSTIGMNTDLRRFLSAQRRIRREEQAAAQRERALALRRIGMTFAAIGEELGVRLERARQIVRRAEWRANNPHWYDDLPVRAQNFLHNARLTALPETEAATAVARLSRRELMRVPNVGLAVADALSAWLAHHGLTFTATTTKSGAPARGRPFDSIDPLPAGRNEHETPCQYTTTKA